MAIVKIEKNGIHRRVDFLYTSPQEYPFALLYFTGSKVFNTVVRQKANDLGYTLNEHEISYKQQGVKGKKLEKIFNSEKEIENMLGLFKRKSGGTSWIRTGDRPVMSREL